MWGSPQVSPSQPNFLKLSEEDPGERYLKILNRQGTPEYFEAQAYFIGRSTDHVKALEMAQRLTGDPDPSLRSLGIVALAQLHAQGLRSAERSLIRASTDENARVRASIPYELRFDSTPESAGILIRMAQDASVMVREHVARVLNVYAHPEAKGCYLGLLRDVEPSVRAAALDNDHPFEHGLKEGWPEAFALQFDPMEDVRANIPRWLEELPPEEGEPRLIEMSRDSSPMVRASAVACMRGLKSQMTLNRLLECVKDTDADVRSLATEHLTQFQGEEVTTALLACARDSNSSVRKFAAKGLESRATESMLPIFERLAEDQSNMFIRLAAARGLGSIRGPESELILSGMLRDPAKLVQKTVRKILEKWAKDNPVSKSTDLVLRYGLRGVLATQGAFNATSQKPMRDWEAFLARTQTLDGVPAGDTEHSPAIVITKGDSTWGLLPFGPAHWIRMEYKSTDVAHPRLGYSILSSQGVGDWIMESAPVRIEKGRKIAAHYGWNCRG